MYSIGYDVGSSSIKAAIIKLDTGKLVAGGFYPNEEMKINSPKPGFAEQDPDTWWQYAKILTKKLLSENNIDGKEIKCIGISYQMHGLVLVDKNLEVLRPSIIWCDSRAVDYGRKAFETLGHKHCLDHCLNSPGNFTASKLKWVKENEPEIYNKIYKMMLPGEFIAMKLTGEISTTISGLSEGIYWDFKNNKIFSELLDLYGIDEKLLPEIKPLFSNQGTLTKAAAAEFGFSEGTVVSYRAGDQPNNALSLNVINPGEVAATAGTSGVVYGVIDKVSYDSLSRVNPFAHVNYTVKEPRLGVLLCINGTGILNSWIRKNIAGNLSYEEINNRAAEVPVGSDGVSILPFGNGAERILDNKNINCEISGLDFNRHTKNHIFRAAQEGIAFSFNYGVEIMKEMGLEIKVIRAGKANMFLSNVFGQTLSNVTGASIELYNTDGAQGAARGAAVGAGYYPNFTEAFKSLTKVGEINPDKKNLDVTKNSYSLWLEKLKTIL